MVVVFLWCCLNRLVHNDAVRVSYSIAIVSCCTANLCWCLSLEVPLCLSRCTADELQVSVPRLVFAFMCVGFSVALLTSLWFRLNLVLRLLSPSWCFCLCSPGNLAFALLPLSGFLTVISLLPYHFVVIHFSAPDTRR